MGELGREVSWTSVNFPKHSGSVRAIIEKFATNRPQETGSIARQIVIEASYSGFDLPHSFSCKSSTDYDHFNLVRNLNLPFASRRITSLLSRVEKWIGKTYQAHLGFLNKLSCYWTRVCNQEFLRNVLMESAQ